MKQSNKKCITTTYQKHDLIQSMHEVDFLLKGEGGGGGGGYTFFQFLIVIIYNAVS